MCAVGAEQDRRRLTVPCSLACVLGLGVEGLDPNTHTLAF